MCLMNRIPYTAFVSLGLTKGYIRVIFIIKCLCMTIPALWDFHMSFTCVCEFSTHQAVAILSPAGNWLHGPSFQTG